LAAFDEVIAKGMSKKPGRRYQTAGEMAAAARQALSVPVRTTGSGRHSARRVKQKSTLRGVSGKTLAILGAAVLLGVALVFGAWQLWGGREDGGGSAESTSATPEGEGKPGGLVPAIAATLPAEIRDSGRLTIGVNVPYAPNEFKNSAGDIVGFDVDLMNAVAKTVGLIPEYREFLFEDIIPTVQRGEINVGMSSFTDTLERQEQVDFVTYFEAGTLWAQRAGSGVDPNAACGLRVGMTPGSTHETVEIPAKSDQCVAAGLPPVEAVVYPRQDELTAAVINGEIDAMSADSPVTGFAIKGSGGALEPAGEQFDTAPYGWPVAKDSGLAESLRQALEHVMSTGEYKTIATKWGVDKGMIAKPVINGAIS
jgi:ABC-type amino acid transport substrate-binding protein